MKPNLGDVIAEKYLLDRVLGEGGMSMVFAAINVLTGKPVAIKWLQPEIVKDEEQSQRLLREAQATSSIDHPNVVNVFDVGRHDGALFLVMELLRGEPLSDLLIRGPQDSGDFVRMMMPVLRGVHAAHRVGVVHRDLKPDNIFMCRDPHGEMREPKVLDFGISKLARGNNLLKPGEELTREGTVFGTPQYMAPEQMRDARVADARSDVYALGVIFYRAFSNEYPYDADTLTALAIRIVEGNAVPLHELAPDLDRGLSDLVMRALALDPDQRFQSVAELGTALEGYSDGVLFTPASYERDSATWLRRDSAQALLADGTPSLRRAVPPPPPPRTGSGQIVVPRRDVRSEPDTTMLEASDIMAPGPVRTTPPRPALPRAALAIPPRPALPASARSIRLNVPPPPPPTSPRPYRGLEVVLDGAYGARRVDRWSSRRQTLLIGAALFAVGSIAPAGWQLLEKARGTQESPVVQRPRALVSGKGANVIAAMEQQRAQEAATSEGAAHRDALAPAALAAVAESPVSADDAVPVQEEGGTLGRLPAGLNGPSARPESRRRSSASRIEQPVIAVVSEPSVTADETGTSASEALPETVSERNPYLRH